MSRVESTLMGIGEMSRRSGLSVSALRFYDDAGLLTPAYVDPCSGYRRYQDEQVAVARIVANLRRVSMPLDDVRRVLAAVAAGAAAEADEALDKHLHRLESGLADARVVLSRVRTLIDTRETTVTTVTTAQLTAADLAAALDRVRFAVSTDPELPALGGVLVEVGGGTVRLVATDRYRLAVAEAGGTGRPVTEPDVSVLVAARFLDDVRSSLAGAGSVLVRAAVDRLDVVVDGVAHSSPAIEHDFPTYRPLLPGARDRRVPLDVTELRAALAGEPGAVTRLAVTGDDVVAVVGDGVVAGDNGDVVLGVDPGFLLQALEAGGSERLVLELDGPVSPLVIRPADDDGCFSLLMPVRLDA